MAKPDPSPAVRRHDRACEQVLGLPPVPAALHVIVVPLPSKAAPIQTPRPNFESAPRVALLRGRLAQRQPVGERLELPESIDLWERFAATDPRVRINEASRRKEIAIGRLRKGDATIHISQRAGALHLHRLCTFVNLPPAVVKHWREWAMDHKAAVMWRPAAAPLEAGNTLRAYMFRPDGKNPLTVFVQWCAAIDRAEFGAMGIAAMHIGRCLTTSVQLSEQDKKQTGLDQLLEAYERVSQTLTGDIPEDVQPTTKEILLKRKYLRALADRAAVERKLATHRFLQERLVQEGETDSARMRQISERITLADADHREGNAELDRAAAELRAHLTVHRQTGACRADAVLPIKQMERVPASALSWATDTTNPFCQHLRALETGECAFLPVGAPRMGAGDFHEERGGFVVFRRLEAGLEMLILDPHELPSVWNVARMRCLLPWLRLGEGASEAAMDAEAGDVAQMEPERLIEAFLAVADPDSVHGCKMSQVLTYRVIPAEDLEAEPWQVAVAELIQIQANGHEAVIRKQKRRSGAAKVERHLRTLKAAGKCGGELPLEITHQKLPGPRPSGRLRRAFGALRKFVFFQTARTKGDADAALMAVRDEKCDRLFLDFRQARSSLPAAVVDDADLLDRLCALLSTQADSEAGLSTDAVAPFETAAQERSVPVGRLLAFVESLILYYRSVGRPARKALVRMALDEGALKTLFSPPTATARKGERRHKAPTSKGIEPATAKQEPPKTAAVPSPALSGTEAPLRSGSAAPQLRKTAGKERRRSTVTDQAPDDAWRVALSRDSRACRGAYLRLALEELPSFEAGGRTWTRRRSAKGYIYECNPKGHNTPPVHITFYPQDLRRFGCHFTYEVDANVKHNVHLDCSLVHENLHLPTRPAAVPKFEHQTVLESVAASVLPTLRSKLVTLCVRHSNRSRSGI